MSRLDWLEKRRRDPSAPVKVTAANEVYQRIRESESVRYAIGSMQPIDPEYTKNTYVQGDRVRDQLKEHLAHQCDYEYQGSTTTDTHIEARSDIDLLMINTEWVCLEPPQRASSPYVGDDVASMRVLRRDAEAVLKQKFTAAKHDTSSPRCITVSGGSLTRKIDVVPATWYNTNDYVSTGDKLHRGVKVFNRDTGEFIANLPFLNKRRIEERDQITRGGLRKAIRLMKTLRYDSEGRSTMSSYNICGIAYNIPVSDLLLGMPRELAILEACYAYCERLKWNSAERDSIRTPNGHRAVFGGTDGATLTELNALALEIAKLRSEIISDAAGAYRSLAEAEVRYAVA